MRNFDISMCNWRSSDFLGGNKIGEVKREENEGGGASDVEVDNCSEDSQSIDIQSLGNLSPEALNYIQKLESELSTAKKELNARKQENLQMESIKESNNDLWECLRSLDSDMKRSRQRLYSGLFYPGGGVAKTACTKRAEPRNVLKRAT